MTLRQTALVKVGGKKIRVPVVRGPGVPRSKRTKPSKAALNAQIKKVVDRNLETKYVAATLLDQKPVNYFLGAQSANQKLINLIPEITRGDGTNQRVGNEISPVKLQVHVQYTWDADLSGAAQFFVRQFHVTNKSIKSRALWTTPTAVTEQAQLLDNGNGTTSFPDGRLGTWTDFMKPIFRESWTSHKGSKTFYIQKNGGVVNQINLDLAAPSSAGNHQLVQNHGFSVSLPKKLKYDEDATTPTNALPLFGCYNGFVTNEDMATIYPYDRITFLPTPANLLVTVRVDLWYKDA